MGGVTARPLCRREFSQKPLDPAAFDAPIIFHIEENRRIHGIQSDTGFGTAFSSITQVMIPDFPETTLNVGDTWVSQSAVTIPGFSKAIDVKFTSTMTGIGDYWGYNCAEIRRSLSPGDKTQLSDGLSSMLPRASSLV